MPTNLYGPGDNYHLENSHVIPALLQRFHAARLKGADEVVIWGSGKPMREFLYVDDMARACVHVMGLAPQVFAGATAPMQSHLNVGSGVDISIRALAQLVGETVGFRGRIVFDARRPDGTPRKLLDVGKLQALGWRATMPLREGLRHTYAAFLEGQASHVAA
jgi:GDP-L-fucose synthase